MIAIISCMVAVWSVGMVYRMEIRAHWWAWRLVRVESTEERQEYLVRLASVGDASRAAASRLLNDPRPDIRRMGITVLHYCTSPVAEKGLWSRLEDPDEDVCLAAVNELALRGRRSELSTALIAKLHDTHDLQSARVAAASLERVGGPQVEEALLQMLTAATDRDLVAQIADSLGMLACKAAAPQLKGLLGDQRKLSVLPAAQRRLIRMLRGANGVVASKGIDVGALAEAAQAKPTVGSVAARALSLIEGQAYGDSTTQPAVGKAATTAH